MEEDDLFTVKFMPEALAEMGLTLPADWPPVDELMLKMRVKPCKICGELPKDGQLGAIDIDAVTEDGEVLGEHTCGDCLSKGN